MEIRVKRSKPTIRQIDSIFAFNVRADCGIQIIGGIWIMIESEPVVNYGELNEKWESIEMSLTIINERYKVCFILMVCFQLQQSRASTFLNIFSVCNFWYSWYDQSTLFTKLITRHSFYPKVSFLSIIRCFFQLLQSFESLTHKHPFLSHHAGVDSSAAKC